MPDIRMKRAMCNDRIGQTLHQFLAEPELNCELPFKMVFDLNGVRFSLHRRDKEDRLEISNICTGIYVTACSVCCNGCVLRALQ